MQTHKRKASKNSKGDDDLEAATWQDVIRDAESEIVQARKRITRLEGVVRVCQRMAETGEPFPARELAK